MPSKIVANRTDSERHVDNVLVNGFRKLFPYLKPAEMEDPARAAFMAAVSNMGTYAFGAYDEPEVEGFTEHTTSGNVVRHLCLHWLHHAMEGVFKIKLHDGKNIRDSDGLFGGHSDPYIVFSARGSCVRSEVVRNTGDPVWNSTHYLVLRKHHLEPDTDKNLRICLLDCDTQTGVASIFNVLNRDDYLGCLDLDIGKLKKQGPHEMNVALKNKNNPSRAQGSLRFSIEFLSVETALGELESPVEKSRWMEKLDTDEDETDWKEITLKTSMGYINTNPVAFIDAASTGTQAWVHVNFDAKVIIVAFRGTEMKRLKDILTDASFLPAGLSATTRSSDYAMKPTESLLNSDIRLHRGFRDAYDSIRESILRIVYDLSNWDPDWTVCVTGHSLGGALASICAFELANRKISHHNPGALESMFRMLTLRNSDPVHPVCPKVGLMNFGAPKVGNGEFVRLYNQTIPETLRVVNATDMVHFLPPLLYTHTNHEVVLEANGEVRIQGTNVQSGDYANATLAAMEAGDDDDDDEGKRTTERAFRGISVRTHMQPYYYEIVQAAVNKFFRKDIAMRGHPVRVLRTRQLGKRPSGEAYE